MTITRHRFRGVDDMLNVVGLLRSMPLACRHVVDAPWRLSSPAIAEGRDAVYWRDAEGQVVGLAAWQQYWAALDFFILAGPHEQEVERALFAWAGERFRERDAERGRPLPYAAEFRDDDHVRREVIRAHGFTLDERPCYVIFEQPLGELPPVPALPEGFTLRQLHGEAETEAYAALHRAAFESDSMTAAWRARTLRMPQYHAALDVVISAPDGALAAFCVGWLAPTQRIAQIEPCGAHPDYRRLGLGHVLLLEMLKRFTLHGAERALVETNLERDPARHAYEAVGFRQTHLVLRGEKWASSGDRGENNG